MITYWVIWELPKETPNGYNQAVFRTLKEMMDYLEESYGPDYDHMTMFELRTLHVKSWTEAIAITHFSHGLYKALFQLR